MTREEATVYWKQRSKHIHNWLEENEDEVLIGEYVEAIDMAIEALSAEAGHSHEDGQWFDLTDALTVERNEFKQKQDLISRTKLFNKLATVQAPPEANEYKAEVYKIIQSMGTEENDDK